MSIKEEIDADVYDIYKERLDAFEIEAYSIRTKKFTEEQHMNLCTDAEVNKVMEEMQTTIKEVEESEYYRHMIQHLRNDEKIRNSIFRLLGCGGRGGHKEEEEHGRLQMVMYGVGSPQFNYRSQYQLSLAILLTRDLPNWIEGTMEFFDTYITPVDAKVMEALGCKVLVKEERYPVVERPTLFFMPQVHKTVFDNLLIANWCPSRLNKMVLFTHSSFRLSFFEWGGFLDMEHRDKGNPMTIISNHGITFNCEKDFKTGLPFCKKKTFEIRSPFFEQDWLFINLPMSDANYYQLEAMLAKDLPERIKSIWSDHIHGKDEYVYMVGASLCLDHFLREDERLAVMLENNPLKVKDWSSLIPDQRYPSRLAKRNWCPPSTGWIKLNFSAVAVAAGSYKVVLGYGGILHNENKECLHRYSCPLLNNEKGSDVVVNDLDLANAEALKKGLRLYMELRATTTLMDNRRKLVIEGDSISLVRWVNGMFPPPKRLVGIVEEIQDLMSGIEDEHVVFHIYKEANSMAIDLANQGAKCIV